MLKAAPASAYLEDQGAIPFNLLPVSKPEKMKVIKSENIKSPEYEKMVFISNTIIHRSKKAIKRGYGFKPLNTPFKGSAAHHLHLEGNKDFVIFLPSWLHSLNHHNSKTGLNMFSVAAIALDYWLSDYDF